MKYASLLKRVIAQLLDFLLFCLAFFPVTYLVKGTWLMTPEDHRWIIFDPICGVFLLIIFAYFIVLEWLTGYTLGKYLMKIRVRNTDHEKITIKQSLARNFGRLIDGLPCFNIIGIISIQKSSQKQRIGDKLAKTFVVTNSSNT